MTDLFTQFDTRLDQAIDEIAQELASGSLTKMSLFDAMKRLYGGSSAEGRWAQRDAYDLLEAGMTRHLLGLSRPVRLDDITALSLLVEQLPTHTVRSEDQIRFQQFSTPADLHRAAPARRHRAGAECGTWCARGQPNDSQTAKPQ